MNGMMRVMPVIIVQDGGKTPVFIDRDLPVPDPRALDLQASVPEPRASIPGRQEQQEEREQVSPQRAELAAQVSRKAARRVQV